MQQDRMKKFLLGEALVCALAAVGLWLWEGAAFSFFDLPAGALGRALTALAGSGRFGFALAVTVYGFFVLLPLYVLAVVKTRRPLALEDVLLAGVSLCVLLALFPRGFVSFWELEISQAMFARLAWQWLALALILSWCVLRLLRRIGAGEWKTLLALFRAMLGVCAVAFVFSVCFVEFAALLSSLDALRVGNTALTADDPLLASLGGAGGSAGSLGLSCAVLVLRFFASALPSLLTAATAMLARTLLETVEDGCFTAQSAACAHRFGAWCARALRWSVLTTLAVNILQALCAKRLLSISISIDVPLFELCFVLAALVGARLIEANAALKADNDLFV